MPSKRYRAIDRPPGTNCHVPGYAEDDALAGSGMRSEYYDTQQDQFAGRPRRDGRAPGTDCWVPGYLNDEDQARVDGLGIAPLVVGGVVKGATIIPSLFNPKATKGNHVQRFLVSQAGGKVRGSKTQGIPNAKILIDQAYYHGWQHAGIPDAQDWRNTWDEMFQQAIPELKAYMLSKMPSPALPTAPGTKPPVSTILPVHTGPTFQPPVWTPPPPKPGEVISTQPLPQLPGGSYQPPVPGYDPGYQPSPGEAPPAAAGGGFKDLLSNPTTLILAGVAAFALLGGGGRRSNPRRRRR